ncbi:MAG: NADH oxidase, partial [Oscillospiraceae bacterium]
AILGELGSSRLICTQSAIAQAGIQVLLNTTCKEIGEGTVTVESEGAVQTLAADIVVMAIGSKPVPSGDLQAACETGNIPCYVVGDALAAPRLAMDAIREALAAARSI